MEFPATRQDTFGIHVVDVHAEQHQPEPVTFGEHVHGLTSARSEMQREILFLQTAPHHFLDRLVPIHHEDMEILPLLELEINGSGRTCLIALPAPQAVVEIKHVMVGNGMRYGQINGRPLRQSGVELAVHPHRTDLGTLAATDALGGVHQR